MSDFDNNTLFRKGMAFIASEEWDLAREAFEKLVKEEPDEIYWHLYLGISYMNTGEIEKAKRSFRTATIVDPENEGGHFFLAHVLLNRNNDPDILNMDPIIEAVEHLLKATKLNPQLAQAHYKLGVAYACLGIGGEALKSFQTALDLEPDGHGLRRPASRDLR